MTLYITTNRYGTELGDPEIFKTKEEAENSIKNAIHSQILEEVLDEVEDAGIDPDDIDAVLNWADANDYCTSYNCDCIDTCTIGDDWYEFKISEIDVSKFVE